MSSASRSAQPTPTPAAPSSPQRQTTELTTTAGTLPIPQGSLDPVRYVQRAAEPGVN